MSEDPSYLLTRILEFTGLTKEPGKKNRLFKILSWYTSVEMVVTWFSVCMFVFEDHPFLDKVFSLEAICSVGYLATKIVNVKIRRAKFWQILHNARALWSELKSKGKFQEIFDRRTANIIKIMNRIVALYIFPSVLTVALSLLDNLLKKPEERELIYKLWDPFKDTLGEDFYWSRYIFEAVTVSYTLMLFGVVGCMLILCCDMACLQMEVLIKMLEEDRINVIACVRLHQKIIKFVKDINDYFSGLLLLELILAALVISLRTYVVILMWKAADPRLFGELAYLIIVFFDPFMICYSGQIVTDMSEKLYRSSYQSHWYNLSVQEQKSLNMLMRQSSVTLRLRYRSIMTFDMIRYSGVVQGTYSYITILLQA